MDGRTDIDAAALTMPFSARLKGHDPEAVESLLRGWTGPVHRYCATVCHPDLALEAVETAFADLFEKVQSHSIDDDHLPSALMRCTRLAAADRAMDDEEQPAARVHGEASINCEATPLFLVGSPKVRAGLKAQRRTRAHIRSCLRCRATEQRFENAEAELRVRDGPVPMDVLEAVRFGLSTTRGGDAGGPGAELGERPATGNPPGGPGLKGQADLDTPQVPGFRVVSVSERDAQGVALYAVIDEHARDGATLWMASKRADPSLAHRFLQEAGRLADATHPCLPRVRAVGETPEASYLVTDSLQGRTLMSVARTGPRLSQAIRMLSEIADGLDVAHAAGLVHRQIRPAHVLVGKWLVVSPVIVNFALGRAVPPDGAQAPYMAPEQLRGETAGRAADVYALGCMLFEFLAGTPPFGFSEDSVHGHLHEPPPKIGNGLPLAVDAALERALAKNPDERSASASALVSELARAFEALARDAADSAVMSGPEPDVAIEVERPQPGERELAEGELANGPVDIGPGPTPDGPVEAGSEHDLDDEVSDDHRESDPRDAPPGDPEAEALVEEPAVDERVDARGPRSGPTQREPHPDLDTGEREAIAAWATLEHQQEILSSARLEGGLRLSAKQVLLAALVAAGAAIAVVIVLAGGSSDGDRESARPAPKPAGRDQPSPRRSAPQAARVVPVSLAGAKAIDFDPLGGNGERPNAVANVIDGDPNTAWQTEVYPPGTFGRGVGAYIALPRPQSLREVTVRGTTPGWDAEVYGAANGPPAEVSAPGWTKLGSRTNMAGSARIRLDQAGPVRYCLIWIARLPGEARAVSIGEISLTAAR